jgi:PAS domain S-box-containing protein
MTGSKLFQLSWSAAALTILALAGWFFVESMARFGESIERKNLIMLASTAAAGVEGDYVARLHGDSEDIGTATFDHIRATLKRVDQVPSVRFVYLMTERAGKWLFLADAEDPSSKDYSPPGQVYNADITTFQKVFSSGLAAVDGPSPDAWGVWVSGLAPIFDPQTRKAVAVFGMDIRADDWLRTINHYRQVGEAIAGLVFALAASFLFSLYRKNRNVEALNLEIAGRRVAEASFELANAVLTAAKESSLDGILVVNPQARVISFNQRFLELFRVPAELAKADVDEPLRRHVTALMRDPAAFSARVADLYEHPEESGADRLELADGRIINRHTAPLSGGARGYLGRIWFFRDVTEQAAVELAVRRSEEKYRNLVEATTDYIWECDENVRYTYVSPAARAMLGYESEEIVGKTPFDFMSAVEAARARSKIGSIAAARQTFSQLENSVLRKDGLPIVLETSGVPIFDQSGVFSGYRGIDRDISARKEAEATTEYRGALLHTVSVVAKELLTAPTIEIAMATVLKALGEAARVDRVLVWENQTPTKGAATLSLRYAWHSPQAAVIVDAASAATMAPNTFGPIDEGQARSAFVRDMPDGAAKSLFLKLGIRANLVVPVAVDGKVWGRIGFDDCTTERAWSGTEIDILTIVADMIGGAIIRERYVEELKNANTIVESSPTILFRLRGDPSLSLIYVSHNVILYGYNPAEMIASPLFWQTIVHPDDALRVAGLLARMAVEGRQPDTTEFRMRAKDGAYYWLECRYTPVRDAGGRLVEIEGLLADITERKKAADEIVLLVGSDGSDLVELRVELVGQVF